GTTSLTGLGGYAGAGACACTATAGVARRAAARHVAIFCNTLSTRNAPVLCRSNKFYQARRRGRLPALGGRQMHAHNERFTKTPKPAGKRLIWALTPILFTHE